jgi:hypothetical protein
LGQLRSYNLAFFQESPAPDIRPFFAFLSRQLYVEEGEVEEEQVIAIDWATWLPLIGIEPESKAANTLKALGSGLT